MYGDEERQLVSLERLAADLRHKVDLLLKRPICQCKGGKPDPDTELPPDDGGMIIQ